MTRENAMQRIDVNHCTSVSEAIQTASLDWQAIPQDIYLGNGSKIENRQAIVRSDTMLPLGVVSDKYAPISNVDTFSFFDDLISTGVVKLDSAGFVGNGKNVFLQGKVVNGTFETSIDDASDLYIMAWNSHDGSSSLKFLVSALRFVCQNMFRLMQSDASTFINARHTINSVERWKIDVGKTFQTLQNVQEDYSTKVKQLQSEYMGFYAFGDFAKQLVGDNEKKLTALNTNFISGQGAEKTRFTRWGALNAVTEYTTHEQAVRSADKDTARFFSSLVGPGNSLNTKAYNLLLNAA